LSKPDILVGMSNHKTKRYIVILCAVFIAGLVGCVPARPESPYPSQHYKLPANGADYSLYVPSYYSKDRDWPLVIALHGTPGFDNPDWQVDAWKDVAQRRGLIVAAPQLKSVQGILPVLASQRLRDLASDEQTILALIDDVAGRYNIDRKSILLIGFSAGGYPLYYTGLRNPTKFNMVIAGAANSSMDIFNQITITPEDKALNIAIFYGKDDLSVIRDQSWQAYAFLRSKQSQCYQVQRKELGGGHLRRPEIAYELWSKHLDPRHKMRE
jgi:poly(3-hydroxybutyrate) depolymerase